MGNSASSSAAGGLDGQRPIAGRLDGRENSVSISPLQRPVDASPPVINQFWMNGSYGHLETRPQKGIPTLITWSYGGNEVVVEGSWDNWASRRALHRSGKDHSVLLVLPSGVYYYYFIIDGELRHVPDLPSIADENGRITNILDVNDIVPEILESVKEFKSPPSPFNSYAQPFLEEEEFAKEPPMLPPHMLVTDLGPEPPNGSAPASKPHHVVLNHLYIEKGWASRSVVALGLTHRYRSKYVTTVLYKPLKK